MITSSYLEYQEYTSSVSSSITPYPGTPKVTPTEPKDRQFAKDLLNPSSSQSLEKEYPDNYSYVASHTSSGANSRKEQGWTEVQYKADPKAGGMVRNALLSGSYGELKKLKVDSEVNAETITTSWSASIGENLRVGNNAGVAGYLNLGNTASLATGSSLPGQDPTRSFAPNSEGVSDLRLIVSDSALVQKNLYVKENASVSGNLAVEGDTDFDGDLQVQGNAGISGSLKVSGSAWFYENLSVEHSASAKNLTVEETGTFKNIVVQNTASLHQLNNLGDAHFTQNVVIDKNLVVHGTTTTLDTEELTVKDKSITVAASASTPAEANGAGIDIAGAGVEFRYSSSTDTMGLNKGLDIYGNERISGDLDVEGTGRFENLTSNNTQLSGSTQVSGTLSVTGSTNLENTYISSASVKDLHVLDGGIRSEGPISGTFYGDGSHLTGIAASIASSSVWKTYLDFEAENYQRVTHPFKTTDVFVQVYRWDDPDFHPDIDDKTSFSSPATLITNATIKIIDTESVDIGYAEAINGYAVIADAGMLITGSIDVFSVTTDRAEYEITDPDAIYRFSHKLGTENIIATFYQYADIHDGTGTVNPVQIIPEQLSIPDKNHIDVVFGRAPITGYVVIAKAGHVIKAFDISEAIEDWNIHYGTEGNWTANSFTATTHSAEVAIVQDYIDTPKIGNRETGPQYIHSQSWESYIEFNSASVDTYIKDIKASGIPDTRIVSNLDSDGNLKIRGSLYTNEPFTTSDIRRKENIKSLENALERLEQIRGVRFNWKDSKQPSIGVVAQEVETIYPELTRVTENLDGEEQLTVNYNGLIGVLIEAVKELSTRVKELEKQNENR